MSPPSESDPLLPVENGSGQSHSTTTSLKNRILHFVAGSDGEPTWLQSLRFFFLGSYFNVLLLLVPLGGVAHYANWDAGLRFLFNFLAIIPLARVGSYLTQHSPMIYDLLYNTFSRLAFRCRNRSTLRSARRSIRWPTECCKHSPIPFNERNVYQLTPCYSTKTFGNAVEIIVGAAALFQGTARFFNS